MKKKAILLIILCIAVLSICVVVIVRKHAEKTEPAISEEFHPADYRPATDHMELIDVTDSSQEEK